MGVPPEYRLANAALLARTAIYRKTLNAGQAFTCALNTEYTPFIGLDLAVQNASGGAAVLTLDGRELTVPVGGVEISNTWYNELKVVSAGEDGGLTLSMSGITISDVNAARAAEAAAR